MDKYGGKETNKYKRKSNSRKIAFLSLVVMLVVESI